MDNSLQDALQLAAPVRIDPTTSLLGEDASVMRGAHGPKALAQS